MQSSSPNQISVYPCNFGFQLPWTFSPVSRRSASEKIIIIIINRLRGDKKTTKKHTRSMQRILLVVYIEEHRRWRWQLPPPPRRHTHTLEGKHDCYCSLVNMYWPIRLSFLQKWTRADACSCFDSEWTSQNCILFPISDFFLLHVWNYNKMKKKKRCIDILENSGISPDGISTQNGCFSSTSRKKKRVAKKCSPSLLASPLLLTGKEAVHMEKKKDLYNHKDKIVKQPKKRECKWKCV